MIEDADLMTVLMEIQVQVINCRDILTAILALLLVFCVVLLVLRGFYG